MTSLRERLNRAVEIHVRDHLFARLERGDKLRVKLGLDPTAPDLHVGHLVVLDVLRAFQDEGHVVVLIIGDFTAIIGDPSGRSQTRPVLTREQSQANARTYFEQIFIILDRERTEVHGNSEWLSKMGAEDVLRLLGKATLQQVLQREDFSTRLRVGDPIGAHEILYPFNQAYDSVAIRADVEIGGTDQLFNLLFGREIQRAYEQEPQDIAVFPLLEGTDGIQKMSKSLGNYIALTESAEDIYGKTMSIPDHLVGRYLLLISGMSHEELDKVNRLRPIDRKAALARQLVKRLHGESAAQGAEENFNARFRRREMPDLASIPVFRTTWPAWLVQTLINAGLSKSGNEARRLLKQGGVKVNGDVWVDDQVLNPGDVVQVGKRTFIRVESK